MPWQDDQGSVTRFDASGGNVTVTVVKNKRADTRGCGGVSIQPTDDVDRPWALFTATQDGAPYVCWWPKDERPIGNDMLTRAVGCRTAVPLMRWRRGSGLVLAAAGKDGSVTTWKGIRVTALAT